MRLVQHSRGSWCSLSRRGVRVDFLLLNLGKRHLDGNGVDRREQVGMLLHPPAIALQGRWPIPLRLGPGRGVCFARAIVGRQVLPQCGPERGVPRTCPAELPQQFPPCCLIGRAIAANGVPSPLSLAPPPTQTHRAIHADRPREKMPTYYAAYACKWDEQAR